MHTKKRLGVWMDHQNAHLMEYKSLGDDADSVIISQFARKVKSRQVAHGESGIFHRQQRAQERYYKKMAYIIQHYHSVLLFGPTEAKTELLNYLRKDHRFDHIKIDVREADKMTIPQQHELVKAFFAKPWYMKV